MLYVSQGYYVCFLNGERRKLFIFTHTRHHLKRKVLSALTGTTGNAKTVNGRIKTFVFAWVQTK